MSLLEPNGWLNLQSWGASSLAGNKVTIRGCYLLCDSGYHRWPNLICPTKAGLPNSTSMKWSAMLKFVRKDIEGVFGILKGRFHFLKKFTSLRHQSNVDNAFVTCCILHNIQLKDDGYLDPNLDCLLTGIELRLTTIFRQRHDAQRSAIIANQSFVIRDGDNTVDPLFEQEEMNQCPVSKASLNLQWKHTIATLQDHYEYFNLL